MKRIFPFILLLVPAWPALADPPAVVLPDLQQPAPSPAPLAVTKLSGTQLFVVQSTGPVCVLGGVDGLLNIKPLKTPVTVFGNFVNPLPGDDDGRTYSSGYVYVVRAGGVGQVDLLVVGGDKLLVRRTLAVDNGQPMPVPPGPSPVPPAPVPPAPADPFTVAVATAYAADADADKATSVKALAALYRQAGTTTINDPTLKTNADLFSVMKKASPSLLAEKAVPLTRKAVGAYVNPLLGDPSKVIDRTATGAIFLKVATALEATQGVK